MVKNTILISLPASVALHKFNRKLRAYNRLRSNSFGKSLFIADDIMLIKNSLRIRNSFLPSVVENTVFSCPLCTYFNL